MYMFDVLNISYISFFCRSCFQVAPCNEVVVRFVVQLWWVKPFEVVSSKLLSKRKIGKNAAVKNSAHVKHDVAASVKAPKPRQDLTVLKQDWTYADICLFSDHKAKNCCRHLKCCQSRVKNCCVGSAGPYDKIALLLQALLVLQLWIVKNVHFVALLVDTSCSWLIALLLTHRGGKARDSKLVHGTTPKKAWPRTSL